jgi:DNA-binding MarR family transcriptional regulator
LRRQPDSEKLGLAQRRTVPQDRRLKHVVLTATGQQVRAELLREFHRPPPELAELGREDLAILATHAGEARATSGRNYFGGA